MSVQSLIRAVTALCPLLTAAGVAALGGAFLGGALWAALAGALVLLGALVYHMHNLQVLEAWSRTPESHEPLPVAGGRWNGVFSRLDRNRREARAELALQTVRLERFREAGDAMPDGLIYLSAGGEIEWINRTAEQHFGLDHTQDLGTPLISLVRLPEFAALVEKTGAVEPLVLTSPRRPATRLVIQRVNFGGDQLLLVSQDITQLEKLETMRKDFIANVSHELRTPLTVVSGFIETVMDGLDDFPREELDRFLTLALDQSTRMQRLIEDLLALSALETGAPAPNEEQVDTAELVRKVYHEAVLLSGGRHQIELRLDDAAPPPILLGSQKELHSAFANLASNAVRYTPQGGRIVVGWYNTPNGAEFVVEDDGIGIDPKHVARLTERFFRVDRGRSRETGGTGLGLAIVKHIASRHHAELGIKSKSGKGSRFSVRFPHSRLLQR